MERSSGGKIIDLDAQLGDSWVDLTTCTPDRMTPLPSYTTEEYVRLLREAQREMSNTSSGRVSLASTSIRNTPWESPKSPPNSPNTEEEATYLELAQRAYIHYHLLDTDWVWDWSGRRDASGLSLCDSPGNRRRGLSLRTAKVGGQGLFSRNILCSILLSNLLSLLLGATVGLWLSQRRKSTLEKLE